MRYEDNLKVRVKINNAGYRMIYLPGHHRAQSDGFVLEHIVIAEQKYERKIQPEEHVHHIDHNKGNNSPENLEVLSAPEHRKIHREGLYVKCAQCGKEIYRQQTKIKENNFCSKSCLAKYQYKFKSEKLKNPKKGVNVTCGTCGDVFYKYKSAVRRNNFCSRKCQLEHARKSRIEKRDKEK